MNTSTKRYLKSRFHDYYREAKIHVPHSLTKREWGFISYDSMPETMMYRHKAFGTGGELRDYLVSMQPAHVYHSVAFYDYPDAPTMKEKKWKGADLIFDLDADHLQDAPTSYAAMLEMVKKESLRLLDFLVDDFGFDEDYIKAVFSGGRGYHFHITDPHIWNLESSQRREIVDYVGGKGIKSEYFYQKEFMIGDHGTGTRTFNDRTEILSKYVIKNPDTGWGKRLAEYIASYLEEEGQKEEKERFADIKHIKGFGKKTQQQMNRISKDSKALEDIRRGRLDFGKIRDFKAIMAQFFDNTIDQHRVTLAGSAQVDEPVTADIKRLIRLPGSLHGGSGMKVIPLSLEDIEDFKPLQDAVAFSDRPVTLKVIKPFEVQMMDLDIRVEEGVQELPEYAAVYLMCRGVAEYGSY
ncbi:DNA primase small subunit [Methanohalophilus euhalobius]|uniref:DNA primase small subunit PriS n=1 Tax=Methanohalophilus euhalobius TaxID=51203 RepID=A0A285F444_9EURY|nr:MULTISPECIES: DNA primase catalytic subunit PriS [Methanohalophilus]RSD36102.1 MAG: DNA primase [Methanohalophilus sp.]ODV49927.1 MAG: DNA primase [Methanohalophilus sp. 2-GBenrich]RXG34893.1 DNA primase [Methanohalophilus sp. WG1-DM]TCL12378.1 DNA primase small subunit [Methanohalophilus euhalobius]SNY06032.1 DNA primase small subunit [Methanohalophilus euhalobius]